MTTFPVAPIAYVVSSYPAVSHTFILREVEGLRALGLDIVTVSIRQTPKDAVMSELDRAARSSTFAILPLNKGRALQAWVKALRRPAALKELIFHSLKEGGTDVKRLLWQLFYVAEALILFDFAQRKGIRHFHAHFANVGNEVARLAARYGNVLRPGEYQYTFTMHGPTEFFDTGTHRLAQKVDDASAVSCITNFCKSQLLAVAPEAKWEKLKVNYLGVEVPKEVSSATNRVANIICVGRLVEKKGQRVLIEAVAALRNRGLTVRLTLVGDGPMRIELERIAIASGADVVFTGSLPHDEVEKQLQQADIFCLPSFSEGLPVAIMEAMAFALPVVTTAIAGIPELITSGEDGVVVVAADTVALADALAGLVQDEKMRRRLGEAGRTRVSNGFTLEESAVRMASFFESAY